MSEKSKKSALACKHLFILEEGRKRDSSCPKQAEIAEIGHQIQFEAAALEAFDVNGFQPAHYDLLVLCAAIEFADRRWARPLNWGRTIHITVPVIDLETWDKPEVRNRLRSVLRHLTCDDWHIKFAQANNRSPIGARQMELAFPEPKTFAIAYSDGLDSRAVSALSGKEEEALCLRVAKHKQRRKDGDNYFMQIPFYVQGHGRNESSFRSRGFKFAAVTAIAADLSNISRIVVPESGQGALGPVLLPLYNVHADYRNHPLFFRKMEWFIEALLDCRVGYEQPRLWHTKGQTARAFLDLPNKSREELTATRSCWQSQRVVNTGGSKKHCGLCAACLLRRLSMHAAGIRESADTYVVSDLETVEVQGALSVIPRKPDRNIMLEYGRAGVRHLQHLADMADWPDERLRSDASEIAAATQKGLGETLKKLRILLEAHAQEWQLGLKVEVQHIMRGNVLHEQTVHAPDW